MYCIDVAWKLNHGILCEHELTVKRHLYIHRCIDLISVKIHSYAMIIYTATVIKVFIYNSCHTQHNANL